MRIWILGCVFAATCVACSSNNNGDPVPPGDTVEDTVTPPGETVTPPDDTATPPDDTATPPDDTATPPNDTATPPDDTATPPDDTATPPDDTATPPEDTATPPTPIDPWYKAFGGVDSEEIKGTAADAMGNVYVVGTYRDTITIGTETFEPMEPGTQTSDSFVASFDATGAFRWAYGFGALQADSPFEVHVDGLNNVYVAGSHKADLTIGTDVLVCDGPSDVYVVSYDSDGTQLWAKSWGGQYNQTPRDLSVNTAGDLFITGSFQTSMEADGITVQANGGGNEIFVLAVDGVTHEALWIRTFTGNGSDVGTALVADKYRNAVIAVSYNYDLIVDADAGITFDSGSGNFNGGLVRLDDSGAVLWANEYGGTGGEEILGLDMDGAGNIFATGVFSDSASFGGDTFVSGGGHDVVIAGYTGGGTHLWSVAYGGTGFDQAQDLEVFEDGIYITGRFRYDFAVGAEVFNSQADSYDLFVGRFSTADGAPVWMKTVAGDGLDQGNGVGIGGDGGVFVGGLVEGGVTFEGVLQPASGSGPDAAVFRLLP